MTKLKASAEVNAIILRYVSQGATNEQLAALLGVTDRTIARYRRANPGLNDAIKTARASYFEENRVGHGTCTRYNSGCHCAPCTEAHRLRHADYMARKRIAAGLPATDHRYDDRRGPRGSRGRRGPRTIGARSGEYVSPAARIQQAIARGWKPSRIMAELDVTYEAYVAARDELHESVAS